MSKAAGPQRRSVAVGLAASATQGALRWRGLPVVAVTKDPICGYFQKWIAHLREAGFTAAVTEGLLNPVKARLRSAA